MPSQFNIFLSTRNRQLLTARPAAYAKARALVANLTLDERANLTLGYYDDVCYDRSGGVARLGFKGLYFADGPTSMRGQEFVFAFPGDSQLAAT